MANQEHLDILKRGIAYWNEWRKKNPFIKVDLSRANLSEVDLMNTDLREADLSRTFIGQSDLFRAHLDGASLRWAELSGANLNKASLSGANLNRARLIGTSLIEANLSRANFLKSDLSKAYLMGADLSGANFSGADLLMAILRNANIQGARFTKANLSHADFISADLSRSSFNGAVLFSANFINANLTQANFSGADLSGSNLSYSNLYRTNLTGSCVHAVSSWNTYLKDTIQLGLVITPHDEPTLTVDNLEVAQFIYLLLNHQKLRDVLNSVMERGVLLLGRFNDGGLALLQTIAAKLRDMKYLPIIFDFDRPHSRNLTETVMTLVGLSRFVIVDLSGRSVANELRATVPHFKIPFVPIIEESRKKEIYSMFSDFLEDDWVLPLVEFSSKEHLMELLPSEIIKPAERKCAERQNRLKKLSKR